MYLFVSFDLKYVAKTLRPNIAMLLICFAIWQAFTEQEVTEWQSPYQLFLFCSVNLPLYQTPLELPLVSKKCLQFR